MAELNIGNIGQIPAGQDGEEERDTFPWFGMSARVGDRATDLALIDFLEVAGDLEEKDPRSLVAMKDFVKGLVFEDDFDEFWRLAHKHKQGFKELAELAFTLIELVTARPTDQSSDSSVGLRVIGPSSTDASSYSEVRERFEKQGRGDLAMVFEQAEEALAGRQVG